MPSKPGIDYTLTKCWDLAEPEIRDLLWEHERIAISGPVIRFRRGQYDVYVSCQCGKEHAVSKYSLVKDGGDWKSRQAERRKIKIAVKGTPNSTVAGDWYDSVEIMLMALKDRTIAASWAYPDKSLFIIGADLRVVSSGDIAKPGRKADLDCKIKTIEFTANGVIGPTNKVVKIVDDKFIWKGQPLNAVNEKEVIASLKEKVGSI